MRYFAHTPQTVAHMLKVVDKSSLDELFYSLPHACRLQKALDLPPALDELGIKRALANLSAPFAWKNFLGAGAVEHFVPEWISQQLLRSEWFTAYTPYQAEASQGTLQAIFEFQSMIASIMGLDLANASMYDGATALVEALLMAVRTTNKKTVIVSTSVHPEYRETIKTYFNAAALNLLECDLDHNAHTDMAKLRTLVSSSSPIAAIAIQSPNFFGRYEDELAVANYAHEHGALAIFCTTDLSSRALVPSFGSQGADIAVGEGLGLLGALHLGGPGLGLFTCRKDLLRQMPGRIVGQTTDQRGQPGYVLALSTREQHIRREKATSNICTNHNLMALALSMCLAAYGKTGFIDLSKTNIKKTLYFRRCLHQRQGKIAFAGAHYNETVVDVGTKLELRMRRAEQHKMFAGLSLAKFFPHLNHHLLVNTTELHEDADIELLADILCGVHDDNA